jgi:hypothetical protein
MFIISYVFPREREVTSSLLDNCDQVLERTDERVAVVVERASFVHEGTISSTFILLTVCSTTTLCWVTGRRGPNRLLGRGQWMQDGGRLQYRG